MSKKGSLRNTDTPGNSVGSHQAYVRQLVRHAETLLDFEQIVDQMFEDEVFLLGLSIRPPHDDQPEYMVVVRVDGPDGKQVGFHSAPTLLEVVVGVTNRLRNKSMKFKEDSYA